MKPPWMPNKIGETWTLVNYIPPVDSQTVAQQNLPGGPGRAVPSSPEAEIIQMTKPSKVKVGPIDYEIRWMDQVDSDATGCHGYINHPHLVIFLNKDMNSYKLADSFHHEVSHAILTNANVAEDHKDEDCVYALSRGWVAFWRDNPKTLKWWIGLLA